MQKIILMTCVFLAFLSHALDAEGYGELFPMLKVETLAGTSFEIPKKKATLLMIGFEKECVNQAHSWIEAIHKEGLIPEDMEHYCVAVLGNSSLARVLHPFVMLSLKQVVPKAEHRKVGVSRYGKELLQKELCIKSPSEITLVLLNSFGNICWRHTGSITEPSKISLKTEAFKEVR